MLEHEDAIRIFMEANELVKEERLRSDYFLDRKAAKFILVKQIVGLLISHVIISGR